MATIYTDVITNGWSKLQYRAKVDYSIELLDSVVNITSTCTFQYKGTYAGDSWFNHAYCDSNINGNYAPLAQRMKTNPTASKTNWTTAPIIPDEGLAQSNPLTITKSITRPPGTTTITAVYAHIYTSAESGASSTLVEATKTVEYTIPAKVFTISFNANGGVGAPSSISKTYGQSVTLPTAKPTRIGHTFLGWALSSSAVTAQWLAGANFSEAITANTTLYAVWRDDYESPSIAALRAYRCGFELTADTEIIEGKVYYTHSYSYALTEDETVNPSKTYYVYDSQEDEYVEVADPVDADIATYYERSDIYTSVSEPDVSEISTYYELIDDDEAGYARVEATWSIDLEVDEGVVNSATMTGTITPEGHPAQAITFQSGYQGTSGNAIALLSGLDVDTQYTITVTVTDEKGASAATSRTVLLLRAFYIFDFGSQGNAVGIGRAAPQSGMEVGYHATFDDLLTTFQDIETDGEVRDLSGNLKYLAAYGTTMSESDLDDQESGECWWGNNFANAPSGATGYFLVTKQRLYQTAYAFAGNAEKPQMYLRSKVNSVWQPWARVDAENSLRLSGGTVTGTIDRNVTGGVSYIASWNDGVPLIRLTKTEGSDIWRPILALRTHGGGGWAIGNYNDETLDIAYGTKANITSQTNTVTHIRFTESGGANFPGDLTVANTNPHITLKDTDAQSNVTTSGEFDWLLFQDKNGVTMGRINKWISSGVQYMRYVTSRKISGEDKWNILNLGIDASGNAVVSIAGTNAAAAWRGAIGALSTGGGTVTGDIILNDAAGGYNRNLISRAQNIQYNVAPSATQYVQAFRLQDKNGNEIGHYEVAQYSDKTIVHNFAAVRQYANSAWAWYQCQMKVSAAGVVTYSINTPANFRSAIGAAASSDRRLKSGIEPLGEDAVEFINALEPSVYTINGERQVGLIAQDVHEADPWDTRMAFETQDGLDGLDDWERMDDGSPTWKLDYIRIIPPLVAAVQSANRRIESLEAEVAELRALVAELVKTEK